MKPSQVLLLFLRAVVLLILTICASPLNWLHQCLVVSIVYFLGCILALHTYSFRTQVWGIVVLLSPFLLIYAKTSFEGGSYQTFPIWIMSVLSGVMAIIVLRLNTKLLRNLTISLYSLFCIAIAYFAYPNYLTQILYPAPYVYEPIVDLSFTTSSNNTFNLSSLKGKIIVLDFWAIGCIPCFEKFPQLDALYKYYQKEDTSVVVYAVNLPYPNQGENQATTVLSQFKYSFPNILAQDTVAWRLLNIETVPTLLILDRDLKIRYRGGLNIGWNKVHQNTKEIISKIKNDHD